MRHNLTLNTAKTQVEKYPYEIISGIKETYEKALKNEGVFGVLNAAAQLHLSGEKGAYKYALKYIRGRELPKDDLQIIIPTLINIMLLDPKYGRFVTDYLKSNLASINADTLTSVFNKELSSSQGNELQQESLLFIQIINDLQLNIWASNMISVLKSDNDFAIIIALDIWKNRNKSVVRNRKEAHEINIAIEALSTSLHGETLSGPRWLLLYEIMIHKLVPDKNFQIPELDVFFSKMNDLNISFYLSSIVGQNSKI